MNQPRWTIALAWLTVVLLCVSAHGTEPDNSLFDGQWSLEGERLVVRDAAGEQAFVIVAAAGGALRLRPA